MSIVFNDRAYYIYIGFVQDNVCLTLEVVFTIYGQTSFFQEEQH